MAKESIQSTLLFIPDISGFTKFVQSTEIEHSQHIVQELLELLIDSNRLDLVVNEIEGDAIFFFKEGTLPGLREIEEQAELMFIKFHEHLLQYQRDRICDCGACSTAHELSLKIIVHVGEVQKMQIKDKTKLFGPEVIVLHALLKNSISEDQYLLATEGIFDNNEIDNFDGWMKASDSYPEFGEINYRYKSLKEQLDHVKLKPRESIGKNFKNSVDNSIDIKAPIDDVHRILTNLDIKNQIFKELIDVKYDKSEIPRVGAIHQCVLPNFVLKIEISENKIKEGTRLYAEKVENFPLFNRANFLYTMEEVEKYSTLRLQLQIPSKSWFKNFLFRLIRPFLKREMKKKLEDIKHFAENHSTAIAIKDLQVGQ
ncbi:MAG: DUF2652 domain-containing protein [Chitinophagales bacterium]|nr:DUF2652 domain-containing protein [Chitinophagales bacterium]